MDKLIKSMRLLFLPAFLIILLNITGCNKNDNDITSANSGTEDEYLQNEAIQSTDSSNNDDNELLGSQISDYSDDGAVFNNSNEPLTSYDSLRFYGRRVTSVTVTTTFTVDTDTLKTLLVKRTISGNFIIKGYTGGVLDSISKPYTEVQNRTASFKRVARTEVHRRNWRLYQVSAVDGQTTSPQQGKSNIVMNKVEIYKNDNLLLTLNGPDFTSNVFTTRYFNGEGIFNWGRNNNIKVKVYLTSNQSDTDLVAFHWARNSFGFHRVAFTMTSSTPNGGNYDRVYEKSFNIYGSHRFGIFNSYISANTRKSLWDNNISEFSSTYMGAPYRISF
ncbi:MAG: hypothetical protein JST55_03255 [Bacteroidetes bacterium]|nr:hypothetical protein [Bacteroidota bacterium]